MRREKEAQQLYRWDCVIINRDARARYVRTRALCFHKRRKYMFKTTAHGPIRAIVSSRERIDCSRLRLRVCMCKIAKPTVLDSKRRRATSPGAHSSRQIDDVLTDRRYPPRVSPHLLIYAHPTRLILFRPTHSRALARVVASTASRRASAPKTPEGTARTPLLANCSDLAPDVSVMIYPRKPCRSARTTPRSHLYCRFHYLGFSFFFSFFFSTRCIDQTFHQEKSVSLVARL